jgi:hypothetical protein
VLGDQYLTKRKSLTMTNQELQEIQCSLSKGWLGREHQKGGALLASDCSDPDVAMFVSTAVGVELAERSLETE